MLITTCSAFLVPILMLNYSMLVASYAIKNSLGNIYFYFHTAAAD
jgi:hypothetical protein